MMLACFMLSFIVFSSCRKVRDEGEVVKPSITTIDPSNGKPGDRVTITGTGFGANAVIYFNASPAQIVSTTSNTITVIVPDGAGVMDVTVRVGQEVSNALSFTYGGHPAPLVLSLNPTLGLTGDTIVIEGSNFDESSRVLFGVVDAEIVSRTQTSAMVIVPFGTGTKDVTVKNSYDDGTQQQSGKVAFSYATLTNNNYAVIQLNTSISGTEIVEYRIDTVSYFKVGPGADFIALNLLDPTGTKPIKAFITTIDVTNQYMSIKSAIGRDSVSNRETPSSMAIRKSSAGHRYIAGTNSDFYNTSTIYQRNANMVDGVLGSPSDNIPITGSVYPGNAIFDAQNRMKIDALQYSASAIIGTQTMPIDTINYYNYTNTNKLAFFNIYCGKTTGTNNARTEVAVTPVSGKWNYAGETEVKVVTVYKNKGNNPVSENLSVLSGATGAAANFLNQLNAGDVLKVNFTLASRSGQSIAPHNIAGGRQIIMINGQIQRNIWNGDERHPRTGIGYSHGGRKIYMCVIDGRNPGYAENVYTSEMAQIMKHFGATDALNLDGGGSSTMYLDKIGVANRPSDGSERAVAAGLFAISSAPEDGAVAQVVPKQHVVRLSKGGSFTPVFYGLNRYGQVVDASLSNITLRTNGLGTVSGNTFTAGNTAGYGFIGAVHNNISTRIKIIIE